MRRTIVIRRSLLSLLCLLLIVVVLEGSVDSQGEAYTDAAFSRALITFGIARGLNGVISVAQGTEVAIHPAGFGLNFTPGQILDPINDLIEQFSWIMLASSASLGIQKVFMSVGSSVFISGLVIFLLCALLYLIWVPQSMPPFVRKFVVYCALITLFLRFSVPAIAIASEGLYTLFLEQQYQEATEKLQATASSIQDLNQQDQALFEPGQSQDSMMDKARRWWNSAVNSLNFKNRLAQYQDLAADATKHAIQLIVVFLIQTVIFPLLFLWVLVKSVRMAWQKIEIMPSATFIQS